MLYVPQPCLLTLRDAQCRHKDMDPETQEAGKNPLDELRRAVQDLGGPSVVAKLIRSRRSHVANVIKGDRPLGRETAARLRAVVDLAPETWLELLAPLETSPAAPSTESHPGNRVEALSDHRLDGADVRGAP